MFFLENWREKSTGFLSYLVTSTFLEKTDAAAIARLVNRTSKFLYWILRYYLVDAENRKPPIEGLTIPPPYIGKVNDITQDVISLVSERFDDHFGDVEPFYFADYQMEALKASIK